MQARVRALYAFAGICALFALAAAAVALSHPLSVEPEAASAASVLAEESATSTNAPTPAVAAYQVVKVVDGDTIDIAKDGETVRLRLVGMDTPEVVDPRKPVQCFGREASNEGHALLEGQRVTLEHDKVSGTYDKYGRTLAYVYRASDGLFYNLYMIAHGYAHEYDYQNQAYKYRAEFKAAQQDAEARGLGLWSPATGAGATTKAASTTSH